MSLIDSHCHLKTFVQKNTLGSVLARAKTAGVEKFITVGTSIKDWDCYQSLARNNPDIYYSVGLHPCYVASNWADVREKHLVLPAIWLSLKRLANYSLIQVIWFGNLHEGTTWLKECQ
jgi:Tat protein secretion system quality control protein TatD with DNase activity